MKKLLSIFLSVITLLSVIPVTVNAAEISGKCGDNLTWSYDEETSTLTISGIGDMDDYYYDYFYDETDTPWGDIAKKVVITEGVTSIGEYAFYECKNLAEIVLPDSLTRIGYCSFGECDKLTEMTIPNTIETINYSFARFDTVINYDGTSLDWVSLRSNNSKSELNMYVVNCWDETLYPFGSCGENVGWEMDFPTKCLTISGSGPMKDYNSYLGFEGVWFYFIDDIHTVVIEEGIETIGEYAFSYCANLTSVTIPASVTKICSSAFVDCDKLVGVNLPEGLVEIEANAFAACDSLGVLEIPASTTTIEPSGVSSFSAFFVSENNKYFSNDENGVLYNKNKNILIQHPGNSKDKSYVLPETVTEISEYAFLASDNLESVTLHNGITKIGNGAFKSCSNLESVLLPNNITSISNYTFSYCESLKNITVPSSVTVIGKCAFQYCERLETVKLPEGVVEIGGKAFEYCEGLENINISNSVRSIGGSAFRECKALKSITIPNSVTSIGAYAFAESGISNIVLGNGLTNIENNTFFYCRYLREIVIPENVTKIGAYAFSWSSLERVWIPVSVVEIGRGAFSLSFGDEIEDVFYMGTKRQWEKIKIADRYGDDYSNAKIHYSCYSEETTTPTCIEMGAVTHFCDCCNAKVFGGYIAPTGHNYVGAEIPATCTTHGYTKYECENCDSYCFDYTANPTGHTFSEDGVCEVCGEKETTTTPINTQMLTIESVLAMVMNLLAKLFGVFSVV